MSEIRYAKIINDETKEVQVGVGCITEYYEEIGMSEMEVEQASNGNWYVAGYAPVQPEPTIDEKKAYVRGIRNLYINSIEWRVSRYKDQKELDISTTDSYETYIKILQYMQYLRDYTKQENWYNRNPLEFEAWSQIK